MGRDADIVVIGAGINGVAAARALARGGSRRRPGGAVRPRSRTGIEPRGVEDLPALVPRPALRPARAGRAAELARARSECGEELIVQTGGLDFGPIAAANARALGVCGVRHELLTGQQVSGRWPIAAAASEQALYQPDGGTITGRAGLRGAARGRGGRRCRRPRPPARDGDRAGRGCVRIRTDGDEIEARACVVAAGAWARGLLAEVEIELPVVPTRETVTYFGLPDPLAAAPDHRRRRAGPRRARPAATGPDQLRPARHRASGSRPGSIMPGPRPTPTSPGSGAGGGALGVGRGRHDATRSSIPNRSPPRRASTRTRPTSPSCSNGTAGSSSPPPARATASSSPRPSGARSPRWHETPPAETSLVGRNARCAQNRARCGAPLQDHAHQGVQQASRGQRQLDD